jgi:hypothetical protein
VGKYRLLDNKTFTNLPNSKITINSVGEFSSEISAMILPIWTQNMDIQRTPQKKTIISETLESRGYKHHDKEGTEILNGHITGFSA